MRVNPYTSTNQVDPIKPIESQRSANKPSEVEGITKPEGDGVARSGELSRLLSILSETPEIRESLVQEAAIRYQAGEFNTPQASHEAADAILELNQ